TPPPAAPTPGPSPVPTPAPAAPTRAAGRVMDGRGERPAVRVQPVYRPAAPRPVMRPAPVRARTRELAPATELVHPAARVPTDLAGALRSSHGVDVADVPVHRGPGVSAEARSRGARAFSR